jgi:peptidoglycan/xylan/chitin deacetylase (PgdA/CDA1 family)
MDYVRRHFTPITFATLGRILDGEVPAPRRPLIVTFDDGFEDNFRLAFPILRSLNVPATLFISTDYIGSAKTYWFDQLVHLLLTAPAGAIEIPGLDEPLELTDFASRRTAAQRLLTHVKQISNEVRLGIMADLHRWLGHDEARSATDKSRPMTWDNVREMAAAGVEIGSHTVRHPILTRLPADEMRIELVDSKRTIEAQTGRPVTALSYPVGQSYAFNADVCEAARLAGYRFASSFVFGTNRMWSLEVFQLKRLAIERTQRRCDFAALLQWPELLA